MHGYLFKHVTHSLEKHDLKFYEVLLPLLSWERKKHTDTQWNEWQVISKINEFHRGRRKLWTIHFRPSRSNCDWIKAISSYCDENENVLWRIIFFPKTIHWYFKEFSGLLISFKFTSDCIVSLNCCLTKLRKFLQFKFLQFL